MLRNGRQRTCPLAFMEARHFSAKPILLGEAPSPIDPSVDWSKKARATQKLAILVFGSRSDDAINRLLLSFDCINLLPTNPGARFPKTAAARNLRRFEVDGFFNGRITFAFGRNAFNALYELRVRCGSAGTREFDHELGCASWFECIGSDGSTAMFITAPHPQTYYRFVSAAHLERLSLLLRTAICQSPNT